MAYRHVNSISLNALVDKSKDRVLFVESNEDFIDVLFSFLTLPMSTIIRLTSNINPTAENIGCMSNLYKSVENFDVQWLHTEACKAMLLGPRSVAEAHLRGLKLKYDDSEPTRFFLCSSRDCAFGLKLLSNHMGAACGCGGSMNREVKLSTFEYSRNLVTAIQDRGVFVKGLARLFISDDLRVKPSSPSAMVSLLSELGVLDEDSIEEMTFHVGVDKVLNLLKSSLLSKTPLSETLLRDKPPTQIEPQLKREELKQDGKICVKIMVSKSRNKVCYAEAGEDFIDLLFSFLTLPLGYIAKKMQAHSIASKGCIENLYSSVNCLDAKNFMKSENQRAMLLSPKVPPSFRYENQPLDIEEASNPVYYWGKWFLLNSSFVEDSITTDDCKNSGTVLSVMDPKSPIKEGKKGRGFIEGPAMFTVTDDLDVKPISPVSGICRLRNMKVPFNDIEERTIRVGNLEASRLLVASFISNSALTSAFIIPEEPKPAQSDSCLLVASFISNSALTSAFVIPEEPKPAQLVHIG